MTRDPDITARVREWLRSDEHETSPRLLADVLERVYATPQRWRWGSAWPSLGLPSVGRQLLAVAAAAAVVAVALAGLQLLHSASVGGPSVSAPPSSPKPISTIPVGANPNLPTPIQAGPLALRWPLGPANAQINVVVPSGWAGIDEPIIFKDEGRFYGFSVDLSVHAPTAVVTSVCAAAPSALEVGPSIVQVGPSAADLVAAITAIDGVTWARPQAETVGGYLATRLETTYDAAGCSGPSRRSLWGGEGGYFFVEDGVTATLRIVDVGGAPLVIATERHDASADDAAALDAIVASIEIDPGTGSPPPRPTPSTDWLFPSAMGPDADLRSGSHLARIEGIPFTFGIMTSNWEPQLEFTLTKSVRGPQGAEAILRWTVLPDGVKTAACPGVVLPAAGAHALDVARAVAQAPGVEVVSDPTTTTVGDRTAASVEVVVREDRGCDPGYFYTYAPLNGGAMWTATGPEDVILAWAVEVDGRTLFIEGELHPGSGTTRAEILAIVDSMQFR